jgi:hypothetical protein
MSDVPPLDLTPATTDAASKFLFAVQLVAVIDELGAVVSGGCSSSRKHREVVRDDDIRRAREGRRQHEPALEGFGIDDVMRHHRPDAGDQWPLARDGTAQHGTGPARDGIWGGSVCSIGAGDARNARIVWLARGGQDGDRPTIRFQGICLQENPAIDRPVGRQHRDGSPWHRHLRTSEVNEFMREFGNSTEGWSARLGEYPANQLGIPTGPHLPRLGTADIHRALIGPVYVAILH